MPDNRDRTSVKRVDGHRCSSVLALFSIAKRLLVRLVRPLYLLKLLYSVCACMLTGACDVIVTSFRTWVLTLSTPLGVCSPPQSKSNQYILITDWQHSPAMLYYFGLNLLWLDGVVVKALESRSRSCEFDPRPFYTTLGKLFTRMCLSYQPTVTKQYNLHVVPARGQLWFLGFSSWER